MILKSTMLPEQDLATSLEENSCCKIQSCGFMSWLAGVLLDFYKLYSAC
jgi:hypothetical protein